MESLQSVIARQWQRHNEAIQSVQLKKIMESKNQKRISGIGFRIAQNKWNHCFDSTTLKWIASGKFAIHSHNDGVSVICAIPRIASQ